MTGFLNSPIANSAHPDANPAEGVTHLPRVEVETVVETRTVILAVKASIPSSIGEEELIVFSDCDYIIFDTLSSLGITRISLSLDDAETFADGINALVRQMRREQAK